jgi:hypothetical protein
MVKYTINVDNASAVQKHFFIYAEKPDVNGTIDGVFQNVFLSDTIAGGGGTSFTFNRELYAVCGKALLQNGASVVGTFPSTELTIGNSQVKGTSLLMQVVNGAVSFKSPYPTADAPEGAFRVRTGTTFDQGDPYFIGMGNKSSDGGKVITVGSVQASPNATFNIEPHIIYYIATGNYQQGTIFDATTVGEVKKIVFAEGQTQANAKYNPNGTWS